ncbi:MAG: Ltp family lipoprotein, partial [Corynebacterium casei]
MTGSQPNPYGQTPQGSPDPQTQSYGEYKASVAEKPNKKKRSFLKWGVGAVAAIVLFNAFAGNDDDDAVTTADSDDNDSVIAEAEADADTNSGAEFASLEDSDSDSVSGTDEANEAAIDAVPADDGVSTEFKNALRSAENYLDFSSFSYQGLYDQLTSEYGEAYPAEAAQYAMDNVVVDWNQEALESAENYLEFSHFSYAGLY